MGTACLIFILCRFLICHWWCKVLVGKVSLGWMGESRLSRNPCWNFSAVVILGYACLSQGFSLVICQLVLRELCVQAQSKSCQWIACGVTERRTIKYYVHERVLGSIRCLTWLSNISITVSSSVGLLWVAVMCKVFQALREQTGINKPWFRNPWEDSCWRIVKRLWFPPFTGKNQGWLSTNFRWH
jgi:hypothetical protein